MGVICIIRICSDTLCLVIISIYLAETDLVSKPQNETRIFATLTKLNPLTALLAAVIDD